MYILGALCFLFVPCYGEADNLSTCRPSNDCSKSISDYCGTSCSIDCEKDDVFTTFILPRGITQDLSFRNTSLFFQKYHDAINAPFSFNMVFICQQNRRGQCLGSAFLTQNPLIIAEVDAPVNSLNLGLGSFAPEGFESSIFLNPKRQVFAWMAQGLFRFDQWCPGWWADITFTVLHADHRLCIEEKLFTPGVVDRLTSVSDAFERLSIFPHERKTVEVDDVLVRIGFDYYYSEMNFLGASFVGRIPTGKRLDNSRFFQPIIGTRSGSIGFGLQTEYVFWQEPTWDTLSVLSEFLFLHQFEFSDLRAFDLKNGPLSRFLLLAHESKPLCGITGLDHLSRCVRIKPENLVEWWLAFHYQRCNWGFEASYNLFWRQREKIECAPDLESDDLGIFDKTRCFNLTSQSTATIADDFGQGIPDSKFTPLTSADLDLCSGQAKKAISHTITGAISYNDILLEYYPSSVSVGVRYEFVGGSSRFSTLQNWAVFVSASIGM